MYYIQENPHIAPDDTYTGNLTANYTFPLKDGTVNLSVSVPTSVYYGAAGTQSKTIPYIKISTLSYYADIINDPLQEEMYAQILSQTEEARLSQDLTDDEYLELLRMKGSGGCRLSEEHTHFSSNRAAVCFVGEGIF